VAFTKDLSQLKKLDDRSIPGILIGYADGAKAYRIFDPATQRVRVSRDVVFDESRGWDWIKEGGGQAPAEEEFAVEHAWEEGTEGARTPTPVSPVSSPSPVPSAPHSPSPAPGEQGSPGTEDSTPLFQEESTPAAPTPPPMPEIEHATPLEDDEDRLDASYDDEPLRYRTMENILGDDSPPGQAPRLFAQLHLSHAGEPTGYAEAKGDPAWEAAMKQELQAMEKNKTWELVHLPAGHRPISLKWVYKLKKDEKGMVTRHKARLVARGFMQQEGIDFEDAFAPVARMESVRVLLALAAQEGWKVHHMDVKSAFLNGDLKEEVYVRQPPGFAVAGEEGKVYRLRKALYGLRQAPRA